jgi:16S rRNA processing protein RimM
LSIGKITKPIGIKGLVKVISLSDFPERFFECEKVYLYDEKKGSFIFNVPDNSYDFEMRECNAGNSFFRIGFKHYEKIEDVAPLVGSLLMIDEKDRVELPEGQYYYYELIGADLYDGDAYVGKIESIVDYGSGDLFKVINDGMEILIPYRSEFVKEIDLASNKVVVELIEGFL